MEAARIGQTRSIEIPAKWLPDEEDVFVNKVGPAIIIMPKSKVKAAMREAAEAFSSDLFADGRPEQTITVRDEV